MAKIADLKLKTEDQLSEQLGELIAESLSWRPSCRT